MDKLSTEEDAGDSGAETAGSDYSPMSTASSELLLGDLQDPYVVCVHMITEWGTGRYLQQAADSALSWIHPDLQLFRVSECGVGQHWPKRPRAPPTCPQAPSTLSIVLFVRECVVGGAKSRAVQLSRTLQRPPWRFHHSERVEACRSPVSPTGLNFFSLGTGAPLWAVRQVHCGREIVRLMVCCRGKTFEDTLRLYALLLRRRPAQRDQTFCTFLLYRSVHLDIQLSIKRLPQGLSPTHEHTAILEFRVRDVGTLVPLLPRACSPISEARWQTEDYDGNKILLQVPGSIRYRRRHTIAQLPSIPSYPDPEPTRGPACYRKHRNRTRPQSQILLQDRPDNLLYQNPEVSRGVWMAHRTRSMFCLPTVGLSPSPAHSPSPTRSSSSFAPPHRLHLDDLVGVEETDVDTGLKLENGDVDVSVVSGYSTRLRLHHMDSTPLVKPQSSMSTGRVFVVQNAHTQDELPEFYI